MIPNTSRLISTGKPKFQTSRLVLCAMFTALIIIGTFIRIPIPPVPFTLQTLFVVLAGILLGKKWGTVSVCLYTLLGLIGLPIFSGGTGGLAYVLKPTFGYILGFCICSYVVGQIARPQGSSLPSYRRLLTASFAGMGIIYLCGMLYYWLIQRLYLGANIDLWWFILNFFLMTLPKDIVTCFVTAWAGRRLIRIIG
mgnify:CR=1 FL=1